MEADNARYLSASFLSYCLDTRSTGDTDLELSYELRFGAPLLSKLRKGKSAVSKNSMKLLQDYFSREISDPKEKLDCELDFKKSLEFFEDVERGHKHLNVDDPPPLARSFLATLDDKIRLRYISPLPTSSKDERETVDSSIPQQRPPSAWQPSEICWREETEFDPDLEWLDPSLENGIPFFGRTTEQETLDAFAEDEQAFRAWAIVAPSGAGKTRLVNHWLRSEPLSAWRKCMLSSNALSDEADLWRDWIPDRPTILIIDQMYGTEHLICHIISRCAEWAVSQDTANHNIKVRLLVLEHIFPDDIRSLYDDPRWPLREYGITPVQLQQSWHHTARMGLGSDNQEGIQTLAGIIAHVSARKSDDPGVEVALHALWNMKAAFEPLFAALMGKALREGKAIANIGNRRALIYSFLGPERLPPEFKGDDASWASLFVAAASAKDMLEEQDVERFMEQPEVCALLKSGEYARSWDLARKIVSESSDSALHAFKPDMIGETHFLELLLRIRKNPSAKSLLRRLVFTMRTGRQEPHKHPFLPFCGALARNLSHDDQSDERVREYWKSLRSFIDINAFEGNEANKYIPSLISSHILEIANSTGNHYLRDLFTNNIDVTSLTWNKTEAGVAVAVWYCSHFFGNNLLEHSDENDIFLFLIEASGMVECFHKPIFIASEYGYSDLVQKLVEAGVDPDQKHPNDRITALHNASQHGHTEIGCFLLSRQADPNAKNFEGVTPLTMTAIYDHAGIIPWLLKAGADPNFKHEQDGSTALMQCAERGHRACVKAILDSKVPIFVDDIFNTGLTALMLAAKNGQVAIIYDLVSAGADPNKRALSGQSVIEIARDCHQKGALNALAICGAVL